VKSERRPVLEAVFGNINVGERREFGDFVYGRCEDIPLPPKEGEAAGNSLPRRTSERP
jgi:hypothetical protein